VLSVVDCVVGEDVGTVVVGVSDADVDAGVDVDGV